MEVHLIDEPKLEFGNRGLHPDLRFGIMEHGPSDLGRERKPSEIKLSVVGTEQSIEDACRWLTAARGGYQGSGSPKKNLFPAFPGFSKESGFRLRTGARTLHVRLRVRAGHPGSGCPR